MTIKAGEYKLVIYANDDQETFDANGNQIHYKNSNGYESWYEYDANGKVIHYKTSNGYEYWREFDANNNLIYYKDSNGYELWREYDANGKLIHYKNSGGFEYWYNSDGKKITKERFDAIHSTCLDKIIEIDGKKFKLVAI